MKATRQEAIEFLIDRDYDNFNDAQLSLNDILLYGWKGYKDRSNKELEEAYNQGLEEDEQITITE